MTKIADALEMSCFIAVAQGTDCFTLVTVEATTSHAVTQHPGTRHHLDRGAPGALLSGLTRQQRQDHVGLIINKAPGTSSTEPMVTYAASHDEVVPACRLRSADGHQRPVAGIQRSSLSASRGR